MLLNIVDFDPRKNKKPVENSSKKEESPSIQVAGVKGKAKQKRALSDSGSSDPGVVGLSGGAKKLRLDKNNQKAQKLSASHAVPGAAAALKAAKSGTEGTAALKSAGTNLAFESAPADSAAVKQRHRGAQAAATSDSETPDWASVADCLEEEVNDVVKLFREQLDMVSRTADTDKVFSCSAIKDCRDIHPYLVSLLTDKLGLEYFTKVQALTLPLVLAGNDVLIKTQTGSGKSLALLLPLVQLLQAVVPPITRTSGVQALVLCPTHELAEQTHQLLQQLLRPFVRIVSGQLVGGIKRKSQKASLRRGLNILVATPRRLLDHLESSSRLDLGSSLRLLLVDEADRLTELGYEKDVRKIIEAACCGGRRPQTLLCSATLSDGVERLAGLVLNQPSRVFEDDALPDSVRHHVIAAPTRMRLRALLAVVRQLVAAGHKAAVFLPTQASVDFHHSLLSALLSDSVPLCRLHGNLSHAERIRAFREFASRSGSGLLVTTDVSARGLDLTHLAWVIQGPGDPQVYCHRAGRTARLGRPGRSLLLLDIGEAVPYLRLLTAAQCGSSLKFATLPLAQLLARCSPENFQQLADLVTSDEELLALAESAFISTVRARASFSGDLRAALPMPHVGRLAGSFCLSDPPGVIAARVRDRRDATSFAKAGFQWSRRRDTAEAAEEPTATGVRSEGKTPRATTAAAAAGAAGSARRTSKVSGGRRIVDRMSEFASGI